MAANLQENRSSLAKVHTRSLTSAKQLSTHDDVMAKMSRVVCPVCWQGMQRLNYLTVQSVPNRYQQQVRTGHLEQSGASFIHFYYQLRLGQDRTQLYPSRDSAEAKSILSSQKWPLNLPGQPDNIITTGVGEMIV